MKPRSIYTEFAEDLIEVVGENFDFLLCNRLLSRSPELPTAATAEALLGDVCRSMVRENFAKLIDYRTKKHGACHVQAREVAEIAEALMQLCARAWPKLNVLLSIERDALFASRDYVQVRGRLFVEEAPSATFVRFINDMERLKAFGSETFERNIARIAEVHALNRVAEIMPSKFHQGWSGNLQPGQSVEAAKWAEQQAWRDATGIHTMNDLLTEAGMQ